MPVPDDTQSVNSKLTKASTSLSEQVSARARNKVKDFDQTFKKDRVVYGADDPEIQEKFAKFFTCVRWLLAVAIVATGVVLIVIATAEMREFAGATQASCSIQDFSVVYGSVARVSGTWRNVCPSCRFLVSGRSDDHGLFQVQSWEIEFETGYFSHVTELVHKDIFRCCPTRPTLDCCSFYHWPTNSFCDDWGRKFDASCPTGPWPCYVINLKQKLDEAARTGVPMPPDNLKVGKVGNSSALLALGIVLVAIGLLWIAYLAPVLRRLIRWLIGKHRATRWEDKWMAAVRKLPPCLWCLLSRKTRWKIKYTDAAIVIQRAYRRKLHRRRHNQARRKNAMMNKFRPGAEYQAGVFRFPSTPKAKVRDDGDDYWEAKDVGERMLIANRVTKKIHHAKENPQIGVSLVPDFGCSGSKRVLYEKGSSNSSRKLVSHRILSAPTAKIQRIEIALLAEGDAVLLIKMLDLPAQGSLVDSRPVLRKVPRGTMIETCGLAPGFRLTKVDRTEYPKHNGAHLMQALENSSPPIVMVFEGIPPPFENPPWAEEWQRQRLNPQKKGRRSHMKVGQAPSEHEVPSSMQAPHPPPLLALPGTMQTPRSRQDSLVLEPTPHEFLERDAELTKSDERPPMPPRGNFAAPEWATVGDAGTLLRATADSSLRHQAAEVACLRVQQIRESCSPTDVGIKRRPCSGPVGDRKGPCVPNRPWSYPLHGGQSTQNVQQQVASDQSPTRGTGPMPPTTRPPMLPVSQRQAAPITEVR